MEFPKKEESSQNPEQKDKAAEGITSLGNKAGYMTVIGGFILMFYNGSTFCVGNIDPYIFSYFKDCSQTQAQNLMPLVTLFVTVANFVGAQMIKREIMHPKL